MLGEAKAKTREIPDETGRGGIGPDGVGWGVPTPVIHPNPKDLDGAALPEPAHGLLKTQLYELVLPSRKDHILSHDEHFRVAMGWQ